MAKKRKSKKGKKKRPVRSRPLNKPTESVPAPAANDESPAPFGGTAMSGVTYLAGHYLAELLPQHKEWWEETLRKHPVSEQTREDARLIEDDLIERSQRKPGRPPKPADAPPHPNALAVMRAVRDYMIDYPGSVDKSGKRGFYSAGFKAFVLEMLDEGGLAHTMTAEEAADAIGVSVHTLNSWRYKDRA